MTAGDLNLTHVDRKLPTRRADPASRYDEMPTLKPLDSPNQLGEDPPSPVAVHVAVVDPLPMYRHGVVAVLAAAGHLVDSPDDVLAWANSDHQGLVLLTLAVELDWTLLVRLRSEASRHAVIALVADPPTEPGVRAVRAGARSVLPRRATADELERTVTATIGGQAVMPAGVAAALATGAPADGAPPTAITPEQLDWLRRLAAGATVAELAGHVGYSERAMFRLLRLLYERLGVRTRIEAVIRAQEQGWLRAE